MVVRQARQTVQWRKQTSDDAGKTFSGVPSCDCCASLFFLAFAFSVFCCVRFSFQFIPPFFFFFVPDTEWIKLFLSQTFFLSFFLSFSFFLPSFLPILVWPLLPTLVSVEVYCCIWSHSRTLSIGLLWMRDRHVPETSTWQHTTLRTDKHPCPLRDSNPQSQQASGRRPTP